MSSKGEENSKRRKRIMKKTYRNMALAAACVFNGNRTLGMQHQCADPGYCKGAAGR